MQNPENPQKLIVYEHHDPATLVADECSTESSCDMSDIAPYKRKSLFAGWYVIEDGVVSFSLTTLTNVISIVITLMLVYFFVDNWINQYVFCFILYPPTISGLICLPIWDRMACLAFAFYGLTVRQANVRCYYKMLDGIADPFYNDLGLIFGFGTSILLVAVALFDMHEYGKIHNPVAVCFFLFGALEALLYCFLMNKHKDKFPQSEWPMIERLTKLSWTLWTSSLIMGISMALLGSGFFVGVYFEWITTFLLLNFYNLLNFENPYFSSITPLGKLVTPAKYVR